VVRAASSRYPRTFAGRDIREGPDHAVPRIDDASVAHRDWLVTALVPIPKFGGNTDATVSPQLWMIDMGALNEIRIV
jgi:hypothetical protein